MASILGTVKSQTHAHDELWCLSVKNEEYNLERHDTMAMSRAEQGACLNNIWVRCECLQSAPLYLFNLLHESLKALLQDSCWRRHKICMLGLWMFIIIFTRL